MTRSDAQRSALLDAAERLFAEEGISGVSDRRIAADAGHRNHSAVAYHFGGRAGLLEALVERHTRELHDSMRDRLERSDSVLDDVRALVLPTTDALDALPWPSWRARFLATLVDDPQTRELARTNLELSPLASAVVRSALSRLTELDPAVAQGRARLMVWMVVNTCADVERAPQRPDWRAVGAFLSDAIAGMLQAPSSQERSVGARRAAVAGRGTMARAHEPAGGPSDPPG
ncbi:TetR/AcrR family transcriptional regulator [Xylanimonas protaetiae]|uniref:TetR/AcrR family transcriptional regulator n=1 Tax=Xylanimonas protaetiae TaxID=2509457 RepID=A0A4P6FAT8_9MICO|nr:TetR/AcrR family transcriptional regulator [Xylanimonas protaetiae]QAY71399.1 TetR/AcrR family transcriptional regulator [Xylanimonas protaetiae]